MKNKVEVLAPAGSFGSMQASFKAGADAVYMGGRRFGARAYAENPEDDDLLRAIDYAHLRGKRLYLTVNTLVKESELQDLYDYLRPLYVHGLDAVIVQDLGVLNMVTRCFPDLPVHISTQMSLTTGEAVKQFGKNVTRVVPARELTIKEIEEFKKSAGLELEVFVHGALCYSYSGQCLLSSACGDRSGNRGRCAQPCRKMYDVSGAGKKYILSPKDICTLDRIPDLIEAGVDSFKIEGRMKSPVYACGVAEIYRKTVDLYYKLGREGYYKYIKEHNTEWESLKVRLADLFNRGGFSEGYAFEKTGSKMMSIDRPNHEGVYVGEAVIRNGFAELMLEQPVFQGDVLEIRSDIRKDWYSYTTPVEYCKNSTLRFKAFSGDTERYRGSGKKEGRKPGGRDRFEDIKKTEGARVKVYRLRCEQLIGELTEKYIETKDYVTVNGNMYMTPGSELVLNVETSEENPLTEKCYSVTALGAEVSEAINAPLSEEAVVSKVARSGESDFEFGEFNVEITGRPFLAKSALGAIRRDAFVMLENEILADFRRDDLRIVPYEDYMQLNEAALKVEESEEKSLETVAFTTEVEQYKACVSSVYADIITIDMDASVFEYFMSNSGDVINQIHEAGKKLFIRTNHIADKHNLLILKNIIDKYGDVIHGFYVRNLSAADVVKENAGNNSVEIYADKNLYCANSEGSKWFTEHGFKGCTYPAEFTGKEISHIYSETRKNAHELNFEICVYGREELMISRQCIKNSLGRCNHKPQWLQITSDDGQVYPVYTDCTSCKTRVYASLPLDLSEKADEVRACGINKIRLEFTDETGEQTGKVLERFGKVFGDKNDDLGKKRVENNKNLKKLCEIGHFERQVL